MYCADETDGKSLRACEQVNEALLSFAVGGTSVEPALAESYEASEDATEWTFHLRQGVTFHDGSSFDANDVVMTYYAQWDAASPLHVGRVGDFYYGGASVALAETLGSVAASLCVDPADTVCVGLEINANHIRAVRSGFVTGVARPIHLGSSTQVWDIRISDEQDRLTCICRLTMAVLKRAALNDRS